MKKDTLAHLHTGPLRSSAAGLKANAHRRHQNIHFPAPPYGIHQLLYATDHVAQLHHVTRPAAPGEGPHQIPVDEQPGHRSAHGPRQTGKRLHLQDTGRTAAANIPGSFNVFLLTMFYFYPLILQDEIIVVKLLLSS